MVFVASCQTKGQGFQNKAINTAVAKQIGAAQQVNLPPVPENCTAQYAPVKVKLPKNGRLESDARRLRSGLNLANTKIKTANAQTTRCLGQGGWYETVASGFEGHEPESSE